jgi:hypothetical protein
MTSAVISLGLRIEHELMMIEPTPSTAYLRDVRLQICLIQYCMPKWNCGGLARELPWSHNVSSRRMASVRRISHKRKTSGALETGLSQRDDGVRGWAGTATSASYF